MSREFKINPYWHDEYYKIYNKNSIEIKPGVTNLISCNGGGKTTLLHQIQNQIKNDENVELVEYSEVREGRNHAMDYYMSFNQLDKVARNALSSEGENVLNNFGEFCNKLGSKIRRLENSDKKEFWMLLDGIDSGLSVNEIADIPEFLGMVCDDVKRFGAIPYILIAGNNYELIGKFKYQCLDVINLEYLTIDSYDEYRNFIFHSGELKKKRYEEGTERINQREKIDFKRENDGN